MEPTKRPTGRSRTKPGHPEPPTDVVATVSTAVRTYLATFDAADQRVAALSAVALALAAQLDAGAGMATAAVSKELRATLDAIGGDDDDGDADDFSEWASQLAAPS